MLLGEIRVQSDAHGNRRIPGSARRIRAGWCICWNATGWKRTWRGDGNLRGWTKRGTGEGNATRVALRMSATTSCYARNWTSGPQGTCRVRGSNESEETWRASEGLASAITFSTGKRQLIVDGARVHPEAT